MAALTGQGEGIPSDGGYAVPTQFAFEMLDKSLESEIVRPRCRTEGMTTDTKVITTFDDSTHASGVLFGGLTYHKTCHSRYHAACSRDSASRG